MHRLPARVTVVEMLRRAFALRCPRCGDGALFSGWFAMHEACPECGLRYEREPGYFVGAIYVNYAVTAVVSLGSVIALDVAVGLPVWLQVTLACALAALVPVVFFRYSRSVWLGIDHFVTTTDEAMERRGRRSK